MSFGWSAGDIFTLVDICYKLANNARQGLTSASLQVKSLQNDIEDFSKVLEHLGEVVKESRNEAFLDFTDIVKTIEESRIYLKKYRNLQLSKTPTPGDPSASNSNAGQALPNLQRRPSSSRIKELLDKYKGTGLKIAEALKYTTWGGEPEIHVLQKKLSRHRQTLILYLQILEHRRRSKEDSSVDTRLSNVEAMVKDIHSDRRLSYVASPEILPSSSRYYPQSQNGMDFEDYEAIFKALNEQKRLALMESEREDDDDTLQEWNDILGHLETIHRRVLNAAERTASTTAQRRTASASYQKSLNRILTHTAGTPPSPRLMYRVDTHDSGFSELPPLREESSGLNEEFVQSGSFTTPVASSSYHVVDGHRVPLTPLSLLRTRTQSVNTVERPVLSPSFSSESVTESTAPSSYSPRHTRTTSISSSNVSLASSVTPLETIQFNGWVRCSIGSRKHVPCILNAGYDTHGQVYALQVQEKDSNSQLLIMKLSTHRKRPISHTEPPGGRDNADDGIPAYFIDHIDTEPKNEKVQFFFQDEKSLNKFESLVYGQKLLLAIVVDKISSSVGGLSDRQRIRVWGKGDTISLLFYSSKCKGSQRRYISIQACNAHESKPKKNVLEYKKLQGKNGLDLHDLKIVFKDESDLVKFSKKFSTT
ncbi:hypothetical protein BGW36DRAFT_416479 [Talaromyces proteolyticus]|uniref:Fungal N-terminal domain-containing protein n=1 Tax=Talaromyces proteolyticus TaxID=1131652 RepID=A0AAD4KS11_9EURO|nr:uncharacterized protein BGW36DRAFT_416479 [Talaromyces proteolyticus]KAH8699095.1 hypothetical protein BGW36DRAFT_416479 [Talaromyces proteolyticus]